MNWRQLRKNLVEQTLCALLLSALFARFGEVSFALSAAVLLFAWPVTDVILEALRTRNPWHANAEYVLERRRMPLLCFVGIVLGLTLVVSLWRQTRFVPTLAWMTLLLTSAGALKSIVIEWEDNRPGGWENPRPFDEGASGSAASSDPPGEQSPDTPRRALE